MVKCHLPGPAWSPNKRGDKLKICFPQFPKHYVGMSKALTKIPFILLATWGIHMTYTPPNPPPPKHERFPSSLAVPLENSGFINWIPFIGRVGN